ncbi:MAG: hypothetical protein A2499_18505 [Stygiobacter sp. RIFOXYC12_FULL_38_8]|nr:MAG: hypothetical protein A2X62_03080 [Stygiobacter sp. GWC2_38_9]OGU83492.1 MAG: hypothetical protein A2279_11350 [Stygiobacter sp. RIFOXYA12_FULL_38_9]OGV05955.1 MAG: hypothetical protein A2299_13425 [Stygiobacter sp. RIFOXYB2_FULL_37_11]OGV09963.1 MAG: hypothetical protein A2237_06185 [Stygiobacter sp. RIFOXYA2_FULL_38_8]OGV12912.1 MAG: hypothetical protein A2440_16915 [Stygiobacter sp. RIFOXYC2_FULL_38_25]OGV24617.1 MAG: hypothetical protein A2499_18505 [Stygiobacter sp. RIFOXYC12_FULL_
MKLLLIISIILLIQLISFAHEGKHVKKAVMQDTVTIVGGDTIAINGIYKNLVKKIVDPDTLKEKPMKLNPSEQVFEHLHNKLVHFPIALGVFAFLLTLINFKWKNFDSAILISILIALLFAIGAFITGKNQSEPFIDTAKEWVVELHQAFGLSVLLSFFVWSVFLIIDKLRKYAWIVGLIAFILILTAGFLGGVIAH